jgi:hypothetical protein
MRNDWLYRLSMERADRVDQVDRVDVKHVNMVPSVHNHGNTVALVQKNRQPKRAS